MFRLQGGALQFNVTLRYLSNDGVKVTHIHMCGCIAPLHHYTTHSLLLAPSRPAPSAPRLFSLTVQNVHSYCKLFKKLFLEKCYQKMHKMHNLGTVDFTGV